MANRSFSQNTMALEKGLVTLLGQIPLSTAGAVGTLKFQGVLSVVKSSTATYTITLQDKYLDLMGCSIEVVGGSAVKQAQITSQDVDHTTTPVVVFKTQDEAMVETVETTTALTVYVTLHLRNSKGNPGET
jgi:hypothetical protein